jgi:hypothetical protein
VGSGFQPAAGLRPHRLQAIAISLLVCLAPAQAQIFGAPQTQVYAPSPFLQKVGINQKIGAEVPLDLPFFDESGQPVT